MFGLPFPEGISLTPPFFYVVYSNPMGNTMQPLAQWSSFQRSLVSSTPTLFQTIIEDPNSNHIPTSHAHTLTHTTTHTLWLYSSHSSFSALPLSYSPTLAINTQIIPHLRHSQYDVHLTTPIITTPSESDCDTQLPVTRTTPTHLDCTPPSTIVISSTNAPTTHPTNPQAPPPPPQLPSPPPRPALLTRLSGNNSQRTREKKKTVQI